MKDKNGFWEILRQDAMAIPESFSDQTGKWPVAKHILGQRLLPVFIFRLSALCWQSGGWKKSLGRFFWRLNAFVSNCDINPAARVGGGLYFPHPQAIVIGEVVIGSNVTIFHNVTIGASPRAEKSAGTQGGPVIGDNVKIYAGAVVSGRINIGDGAWIGANAVVLKDVPENSLAAGVPARVIKRDKQDSKPESLEAHESCLRDIASSFKNSDKDLDERKVNS